MTALAAPRRLSRTIDAQKTRRIVVRLRARWDDCDAYGHVNNAVYLALARAASDEGLAALGARESIADAHLAEAHLAYREPIWAGEAIDIRLQVRSLAHDDLEIVYDFAVDGHTRANLFARWVRGYAFPRPALPTPVRDAEGAPFVMTHRVRSYEVDANGEAKPAAILQWLEHAVFAAAESVGWSRERMLSAKFMTLQVGHDLVLGARAHERDELRITSRLIEVRRASGTWRHEVRRMDGEIVALDDSRGAFLDPAGEIQPAPTELMRALIAGPRTTAPEPW